MAKKKTEGFNPEAQTQNQKRIFGNKVSFKSDLFKLEVAECQMNKSWNEKPNLEEVEHVHFFHTYDSSGRQMARTNSVAGHFHVVDWKAQGDDMPVKINSVSGPMKEVKRKIKGIWSRVAEPVDSILEDEHTHEITYRRSEDVVARQVSAAAVNIEAQEAQKLSPPPGVDIR